MLDMQYFYKSNFWMFHKNENLFENIWIFLN